MASAGRNYALTGKPSSRNRVFGGEFIHIVGHADLRALLISFASRKLYPGNNLHRLNLFEDCSFDAPVIVRIMVPVDDQNPPIVELH